MGFVIRRSRAPGTLTVIVDGEGVKRTVVLRSGTRCIVSPPNKAKAEHRGRICSVLAWDDADFAKKDVAVRWEETGRQGRVPAEDLVPIVA